MLDAYIIEDIRRREEERRQEEDRRPRLEVPRPDLDEDRSGREHNETEDVDEDDSVVRIDLSSGT